MLIKRKPLTEESKEYECLRCAWTMLLKYTKREDTEETWSELVEKSHSFHKYFQGTDAEILADALSIAIIKYIDYIAQKGE